MKQQLRNIVVSGCVIVVLAVAILLVNVLVKPKKSTSDSSSTATVALFKTKDTDITSVQVKNKNGTYVIRQKDGKYSLDGISAALSQDNLKTTVDAAADIEYSKVVAQNATDLAQYGLSDPTAEVAVAGAKSATFEVGKETPLSDGCYLMMKGSNTVYKADSSLPTTFGGKSLDYVDTAMISIATADQGKITEITLGGTGRPAPIVLKQETASSSSTSEASADYRMESPRSYEVSSDNLSTLTTALNSMTASGVLTLDTSAASLAKYGLDKPKYTLSFVLKGKTTTVSFGSPYDNEGSQYLPVLVSGKSVVYDIAESSVPFYSWQLADVSSKLLFLQDIDTVKSITVTKGSESYTFEFSGTGDNLKGTFNGKALKVDNVRNFYQNLLGIEFEGPAAQPSGTTPYASFTITSRTAAGGTTRMDFMPITARQSFWLIGGKGDFYVLNTYVDAAVTAARNLAAGKDVAAP